MNAQTLANIARTIAHNTGKTIEFDVDGKAYAGANTDRILYKTPKYADLRLTSAHTRKTALSAHSSTPKTKPSPAKPSHSSDGYPAPQHPRRPGAVGVVQGTRLRGRPGRVLPDPRTDDRLPQQVNTPR